MPVSVFQGSGELHTAMAQLMENPSNQDLRYDAEEAARQFVWRNRDQPAMQAFLSEVLPNHSFEYFDPQVLLVEGNKEYFAIKLMDNSAIWLGEKKDQVGQAVNEFIEENPAAGVALSFVEYGSAIFAPGQYLAGMATGALEDEATDWVADEMESDGPNGLGWSSDLADFGGAGYVFGISLVVGGAYTLKRAMSGRDLNINGDLTPERLATMRSRGVDSKYVDSNGRLIYPDRDGFDGPISRIPFRPGTTFDRYGGEIKSDGSFSDTGRFASPVGTPFDQRSLPANDQNRPYRRYEVISELPDLVDAGRVASWFDQPGGGTQYRLPFDIDYLLENRFIREIR